MTERKKFILKFFLILSGDPFLNDGPKAFAPFAPPPPLNPALPSAIDKCNTILCHVALKSMSKLH